MWFDLTTLPAEQRSLLVLEGKDAERFVQGLISADIKSMPEDHAYPASLLTVKAKLLSDAVVWKESEQRYLLAVPASRGQEMLTHVDRHIIMDELTVVMDETRSLALHFEQEPHTAVKSGLLAKRCSYPLPGTLWVGSPEDLATQRGDQPSGSQSDFDQARIASGLPAWGRELDERRLPPEAGFTPSISYKKGCFMGQEPLARIHARGQVNRVLVRIRGQEGLELELPLALQGKESSKTGDLCTWSASSGSGLAIVHRSLAEPEQALEGAGHTFSVLSGALGDDAGIKG